MKMVTHWQFRWSYLFCSVLTIALGSYWGFYRTPSTGFETAAQVFLSFMVSLIILRGVGIAFSVEAGRQKKLSAFGVLRRIAALSRSWDFHKRPPTDLGKNHESRNENP